LGGYLWDRAEESEYFSLHEVEISGNSLVSREEILRALGISDQHSLLSFNVEGAAASLLALPYVARAEVRRALPDRLVVEVVERKPLALLALGPLYLVDEDGAIFKRLEASDPEGLPIVTGLSRELLSRPDPRLTAAVQAVKVLREAGAFSRFSISEVHLGEEFEVTLVLAPDGARASLGRVPADGAGLSARLERLARVTAALARKGTAAEAIFLDNVSRPERVAVRVR
jgi:cell division protein FtsQ